MSATKKGPLTRIVAEADDVHTKILKRDKPSMKFPIRSLANVKYTPKQGYFEMPRQEEGAHAHRQHGQDLRPDAAHDGARPRS